VIDAVLVTVVSLLVGVVLGAVGLDRAIITVVDRLLVGVYYASCEGRIDQTPGKRAVGIRVVDDSSGDHIGVARGLPRFVVSWFSFIAFLVGYLAMLGDPAGQTWHDPAARAVVVGPE
jgi:uncharacterized RDD family membrane protein YckC